MSFSTYFHPYIVHFSRDGTEKWCKIISLSNAVRGKKRKGKMNKTWHNFLAYGMRNFDRKSQCFQTGGKKIENSHQTLEFRMRETVFKCEANKKKRIFCLCVIWMSSRSQKCATLEMVIWRMFFPNKFFINSFLPSFHSLYLQFMGKWHPRQTVLWFFSLSWLTIQRVEKGNCSRKRQSCEVVSIEVNLIWYRRLECSWPGEDFEL